MTSGGVVQNGRVSDIHGQGRRMGVRLYYITVENMAQVRTGEKEEMVAKYERSLEPDWAMFL